MASNPIQPTELKAYCEQLLIPVTAWQAGVIYRLDDAVLRAWAGQKPDARPTRSAAGGLIPVENTAELKAMFRGVATAKRAQRQAQAAQSTPI